MKHWLFLLPLLCEALHAAESAEKKLGGNVPPLAAESLLNTAGGLLLVLAVIVGGAWLFKRYTHLPLGGKGMVRVVGGASVGARERVVVVEVEETRIVLGVAPGQVNKLHVLPGSQQSFQDQLQREESQAARDTGNSEEQLS
jgi:flagellar protein FliO/FliZ